MSVLAGPFTIACVLLALGGALKALRPHDTAHALATLRLPHAAVLVRIVGAFEAVVGVGALLTGDAALAALVAVSYLAFALFVLYALRSRLPISSCGCFGKVDTPPSMVHVVIDVAAALVAVGVVAGGDTVALPDVLADQPLLGIPFVLLIVVGTFLAFLAFTALPKTLAATRTGDAG